MRHVLAYLFSLIAFGIGTAFLWFGRHNLGESTPLLLSVVGFYVAALASAFPAQADVARQQLTAWYTTWKAK